MKRIAFLFVAVVTATGVIAWMAPSSLAQDNKGQVTKTQTGTKDAKQIIVTTIPRGYRDWKFISAAHEAGELNDIRVAIGNDKAIKAYRAGKPFPEGTIIGESLGQWFHQKRTTKYLVKRNRLSPETHPTGTYSLWKRIPRSTPRRAVGVTRILVKTSNRSLTKS